MGHSLILTCICGVLLTACSPSSQNQANEGPPANPVVSPAQTVIVASETASESTPVISKSAQPPVVVNGRQLQLLEEGDFCVVETMPLGTKLPASRMVTSLAPPCFWARWRGEPPPADAQGKPIGHDGEVAAWVFVDDDARTVIAVIGDRVAPEKDERLRANLAAGIHCGASAQGISLSDTHATLEQKRSEGFMCAEGGIEQRDFWLLVHP